MWWQQGVLNFEDLQMQRSQELSESSLTLMPSQNGGQELNQVWVGLVQPPPFTEYVCVNLCMYMFHLTLIL